MKSSIVFLLTFLTPCVFATASEIVISNDTMQFDIKSFEVKAGDEVKLTLKNVGKLPKIAMGHNLVILKKGDRHCVWAEALGAGANANNPLPDGVKGDVVAFTKLLGPDESDTITFTAPAEAGNYEYVCTFPGHFAMMLDDGR